MGERFKINRFFERKKIWEEGSRLMGFSRNKIWEKCLRLMGFSREKNMGERFKINGFSRRKKTEIFLNNIGHDVETSGLIFCSQKLTLCTESYLEVM